MVMRAPCHGAPERIPNVYGLVELRMRPMSLAEHQIETPVIGLGENAHR
jgi:hypothetical protein